MSRRLNPLTGGYVLCSPNRTNRPWQGQSEAILPLPTLVYDAKCYLCPGNVRASNLNTPDYDSTFTFLNDYPALTPPADGSVAPVADSLFTEETVSGLCHVIIFNKNHSLTIPNMSTVEISAIVTAWTQLYVDLSAQHLWLNYIQIFENKGTIMGCSNTHPHGQSWSLSYIPTTPLLILQSQRDYANKGNFTVGAPVLTNGKPSLLLSYVHQELATHAASLTTSNGALESRVICEGEFFVALVPYWAGWPFESMILPKFRHISSLAEMTKEEHVDLADVIRRLTTRFDNLFSCSFGYSMGLYQAPVHRAASSGDEWTDTAQFHIGFYPPLLRSSTVKKFLVGFELFAETQRDITPEQAAKRLRDCSEVHYSLALADTATSSIAGSIV